jgi:hypothetical protein
LKPNIIKDINTKIIRDLKAAFAKGWDAVEIAVPLPPFKIPLIGHVKMAENRYYELEPKKHNGMLVYHMTSSPKPENMPELKNKKRGTS